MQVIAIDWSGALDRRAQRHGIRAAHYDGRKPMQIVGGLERDEHVERVRAFTGPLVVGFDFSFSVPAWFASHLGCRSIDDVWATVEREGPSWLAASTPPFWGKHDRRRCDLAPEKQFRACEQRLRRRGLPAKSIFQLVGNGQVGAGSVRGMPLLRRLRDAGFAIWPFDAPRDRMVVEIYPRMFRDAARAVALPDETRGSRDAFDAAIAALGMWEHRDEFASLEGATDPVTRIEGDVWVPGTTNGAP